MINNINTVRSPFYLEEEKGKTYFDIKFDRIFMLLFACKIDLCVLIINIWMLKSKISF